MLYCTWLSQMAAETQQLLNVPSMSYFRSTPGKLFKLPMTAKQKGSEKGAWSPELGK